MGRIGYKSSGTPQATKTASKPALRTLVRDMFLPLRQRVSEREST